MPMGGNGTGGVTPAPRVLGKRPLPPYFGTILNEEILSFQLGLSRAPVE